MTCRASGRRATGVSDAPSKNEPTPPAPQDDLPMPTHLRSPYGTAFNIKAIDDAGTFEGYASLFNREDLGHDVILPGAFTDSLRKRSASGIKLLFHHDPAQPIGVWDTLKEDAKGLYARGRLLPGVARAREVLELMKAGALDGLSIGFKTLSARRDTRTGIRRIAKVDLWEISVVTFPMLPEARIAKVKSRAKILGTPSAVEFELWLTRDAGFTSSEARAFLAHGLKGLHALAAARTPTDKLRSTIRAATELLRA